jgi:hypothetical protein
MDGMLEARLLGQQYGERPIMLLAVKVISQRTSHMIEKLGDARRILRRGRRDLTVKRAQLLPESRMLASGAQFVVSL